MRLSSNGSNEAEKAITTNCPGRAAIHDDERGCGYQPDEQSVLRQGLGTQQAAEPGHHEGAGALMIDRIQVETRSTAHLLHDRKAHGFIAEFDEGQTLQMVAIKAANQKPRSMRECA